MSLKNALGLLLVSIICTVANAQIKLSNFEKLCLKNEHATKLKNINSFDNIIIIQEENSIIGLNSETANEIWSIKVKDPYLYGFKKWQNKLVYARSNKILNPGKSNEAHQFIVEVLNPENGTVTDTFLYNNSIVALSDFDSSTGNCGIIAQCNKGLDKKGIKILQYEVHLYNFKTRKRSVLYIEKNNVIPTIIETDHSGKYLAYGTANGIGGIFVHDLQSGKQLAVFPEKGDSYSIEFSKDSRYMYYTSGKTLKICNLENFKVEREFMLPGAYLIGYNHFSEENLILSPTYQASNVICINTSSGDTLHYKASEQTLGAVFSKSGKYVYFASNYAYNLQCFVSKTKGAFLRRAEVSNLGLNTITSSTLQTNNETTTAITQTPQFKIGDRVFIKNKKINRYYSGVISAINNGVYSVIYDDGTKDSVGIGELKSLPQVKKGDAVGYRNPKDNKYYTGIVLDVQGNLLYIQTTKTDKEWLSDRQIIQIE